MYFFRKRSQMNGVSAENKLVRAEDIQGYIYTRYSWFAILFIVGIILLRPIIGIAAPLDDRIASLQSALVTLKADNAAMTSDFQRLIQESNETKAILLVAGISSGTIGNIVLPVTLIPGPFKPTSIQADFILPAGITFISATLGPIPSGEGKSLQTAIVGNSVRVIIFGLNQTIITEGLSFTLTFKTTVKGAFPMLLQNYVASDATGSTIPLCVTSGIVTSQ